MSHISAQECELLSFFEAEPELLEPDTPWVRNDSLYRVSRPQQELTFGVQPSFRDVRIVLRNDGATVYELSALAVHDVRYHKHAGSETLTIYFDEDNMVTLSLKPEICIMHSWATAESEYM